MEGEPSAKHGSKSTSPKRESAERPTRSPRRDVRAASDDSEASTEIMGGSQNTSPSKGDAKREEDRADPEVDASSVKSPDEILLESVEKSEPNNPRKRKAERNESEDAPVDAKRRAASHDLQKKKARLSPNIEAHSFEGRNESLSQKEGAGRRPALRKNISGSDSSLPDSSHRHNQPPQPTAKRDQLSALDLSSAAARTSSSSHSPHPQPSTVRSPSLRSRQRRSTSFHSSAFSQDRETRSRRHHLPTTEVPPDSDYAGKFIISSSSLCLFLSRPLSLSLSLLSLSVSTISFYLSSAQAFD